MPWFAHSYAADPHAVLDVVLAEEVSVLCADKTLVDDLLTLWSGLLAADRVRTPRSRPTGFMSPGLPGA